MTIYWVFGIVGIIIILGVVALAVWLVQDEANREFRRQVTEMLKWWGSTDEYLKSLSELKLMDLHAEVIQLLKYSRDLTDDTFEKLQTLRKRLFRALDGKREL